MNSQHILCTASGLLLLLAASSPSAASSPLPGSLMVDRYQAVQLQVDSAYPGVGSSLLIDGKLGLIGIPTQTVGGAEQAGVVRLIALDPDSQQWTAAGDLSAADPSYDAGFGRASALQGDTLLISAVGSYTTWGSVYVFGRDSAVAPWLQTAKLTTSDAQLENAFGRTLALDGDLALVGAPYEEVHGLVNAGAVYVFSRDSVTGTWSQTARLVSPAQALGSQFGFSIALHGDIAVIGQPGSHGQYDRNGSAWIFQRSTSGKWKQTARLQSDAPSSAYGDSYGYSVAYDGSHLLVGAPAELTKYSNQYTGGVVYVYQPGDSSAQWLQTDRLSVGNPDYPGLLGVHVAQQDGLLLLTGIEDSAVNISCVYVFQYDSAAGNWVRTATMSPGGAYGAPVAIHDNNVLIGSSGLSDNYLNQVFAYHLTTGGFDSGDAPAPYPTRLADGGPRHAASSLSLGPLIDAESDGQPASSASGDDVAMHDEDGVRFPAPLIRDDHNDVEVEVHGGPGVLDAWIDYNQDGDWLDAGEKIADHLAVVSGLNRFGIYIPATALPGQTYARFRLSSAGSAAPTGAADDGEVEDLLIGFVDPSVSLGDDVATYEGNGVPVTVTLNSPLDEDVTVKYATQDGSATAAGGDYAPASGELTIPAGSLSATAEDLVLLLADEGPKEQAEKFKIKLKSPSNAVIGDGVQVITINKNKTY
jgi:hypothetical protein